MKISWALAPELRLSCPESEFIRNLLGKDAHPGMPVLEQAKAEYARLQ